MKPEVTVILRVNAKHQRDNMEAVYEGFRSLGIPAVFKGANVPIKTKRIAIWGWRLGQELRAKGHDILVCEHAYVGDRREYTSLGWNGLNNYACFPSYPEDGGERFKAIGGEIHPWKYQDDKPVLLLGQLKNDQSLKGEDIEKIYREWVRRIDRPVIFRQHPEAIKRGIYLNVPNTIPSEGTLYEAFDNCSYALAFNSNSLLDAVMYGVPAVAMDKGTMAWGLCGENIGHIIRPEREKRLYEIAHTQWTLDEIATGEPLKKLWEMEI